MSLAVRSLAIYPLRTRVNRQSSRGQDMSSAQLNCDIVGRPHRRQFMRQRSGPACRPPFRNENPVFELRLCPDRRRDAWCVRARATAHFAQLRGRRGEPKASERSVTTSRSAYYHIVRDRVADKELGPDWQRKRYSPEHRARRPQRQLEALGHNVTLEPTESAEQARLTPPTPRGSDRQRHGGPSVYGRRRGHHRCRARPRRLRERRRTGSVGLPPATRARRPARPRHPHCRGRPLG
jgi:hypothetical protein